MKSDVSSSSQTNSSTISATSMVMLPFTSLRSASEEHRHVGVALAQLVQQRRRPARACSCPSAPRFQFEQHGAQRRVGADDGLAVLERERPHHVDIARLERGGDALGGAADRRVELGQAVVDDEGTG